MRSQRLRLGCWADAGMRVIWLIDSHKWKAEPSGMHSHAEHGNEKNRTLTIVLICYPNFKFPVSASGFQSRYSSFNSIFHTTQQKSVNRQMKDAKHSMSEAGLSSNKPIPFTLFKPHLADLLGNQAQHEY